MVFDFDGTLIDTREIKTRNYVETVETVFGTDPHERGTITESCIRTSGANRFRQLDDTLDALGLKATESQRQRFSGLYSELNARDLELLREFPSVRGVLQRLRRAGFALFAASGILHEEFLGELRRRGLESWFDNCRGGDKRGFLQKLRGRGYDPVLFVGDTSFDRATAEEAGVEFHLVEKNEDLEILARRLIG